MATMPQPLNKYPVGADNPEGMGGKPSSFADKIRPALAPKKPTGKPPFQKR